MDERRTWLTNRLTWRTRQERLIWSLFTFYHPVTMMPTCARRSAGGSVMNGCSPPAATCFSVTGQNTFFAQFEDNSNLYARLRFIY